MRAANATGNQNIHRRDSGKAFAILTICAGGIVIGFLGKPTTTTDAIQVKQVQAAAEADLLAIRVVTASARKRLRYRV